MVAWRIRSGQAEKGGIVGPNLVDPFGAGIKRRNSGAELREGQ